MMLKKNNKVTKKITKENKINVRKKIERKKC